MNKERERSYLIEGKVQPQNIDAEIAVLGCIINYPKSIYEVITLLKPEMFYKEAHTFIYEAILEILNDNKPIDMILLVEYLRKSKRLEEVGGSYYLSTIANCSLNNISSYALIIVDKYLRRKHIEISCKYVGEAYKEEKDSIEQIESNINDLEKSIQFKKLATEFNEQLEKTTDNILDNDDDNQSYYTLHDKELSYFLCLRPNKVLLLPSNKGEGKTSFLVWMADGLLTHNKNLSILWFCFEDSMTEMIQKFISMRTNLTAKQLERVNYKLTQEDRDNILNAKKELSSNRWNVEFVDERATISEIKRKIKAHQEKYRGLETVVIIDNFGLVDTKDLKGKTSIEKDDELAKEISLLKKETNSCFIIPHHLTKSAADTSNFSTGYRVTDDMIRGSGRLLDYFPQCITIVRPSNHKDVISLYDKANVNIDDLPFVSLNVDTFEKYIWRKNPTGTMMNAFVLLNDAYNEEIAKTDPEFSFATVIKKWHNHINELIRVNSSRSDQYKSKLPEFEKWFEQGGHLADINSSIPFDDFYYGNIPQEKRVNIKNLFLVESIRDRFDSHKIFRFKCNMKYNQFERIIENE